jgi:DNA-binding NtrC family response regulator
MPGGMDGHELADEITRIEPEMRLVLMSGYSAKMVAGFDDPSARPFLSKPVSLPKLAKVLRKVLDGDAA